MTIRKPSPRLNNSTRRLIQLLDTVLSDGHARESASNQAPGTVLLSDNEAAELARLFGELAESRDFLEALFFVDQVYGTSEPDLDALKSLFVAATARKHGSYMNIHSGMKWQQFLIRLGIQQNTWPNKNIQPMPFEHFLNMERRLFEYLQLSSKTIDIMMRVASNARAHHEKIRKFDFAKIHGERLDRPYEPQPTLLERIRRKSRAIFSDTIVRDVSAQQLGGLAVIVSNSSVLFTTRDWGVTGTISTMSGAFPLAFIK